MNRTHIPLVRPERKKKPVSRLQRGGRIKPVSATKAKLQKIYSALRLKFLAEHPYCQHFLLETFVNTDSGRAVKMTLSDAETIAKTYPIGFNRLPASEYIHHLRGRGKYYLDTSTWMAVSRKAHEKIHADPKTSYEKGYMLPRN